MKQLLFFIVVFLSLHQAQAQMPEIAKPALTVASEKHQFGAIPQFKPVFHTFTLVNQSSETIEIKNVVASCGCTTPEYKAGQYAPGAFIPIKVGYNAVAEGSFHKTITVVYDQNKQLMLQIEGDVYKIAPGSAPSNASLSLLHQ